MMTPEEVNLDLLKRIIQLELRVCKLEGTKFEYPIKLKDM